MRRIVVNGANGYVASYFVKLLLENYYNVICFVRGNSNHSSKDRLYRQLEIIGCPVLKYQDQLTVVDYCLCAKNLGIDLANLENIFEIDIDFWHFAANLKFATKDRDEIFKTNFDGVNYSVETFLNFATKSSRFFLISSAYSCGKMENPILEIFHNNSDLMHFRNCYEQSKRYGENVLREYFKNTDIYASIIRLGQIVGESKTGISKTSYGVFDLLKKLFIFSKKYPNEVLRIKGDDNASQNLVPIDFTVDCLLNIADYKLRIPEIIHLVNEFPTRNEDIVNCLNKLLNIKILIDPHLEYDNMKISEKVFNAGIVFAKNYFWDDLNFDVTNLKKIVQYSTPIITIEELYKMLHYYYENNLKN